jgi:hypothetical protein
MSHPVIRFEQPGRPEFAYTIATAAAKERTDHSSALIVTGLTLSCTAMSIFDLFQLAISSH